MAIGSSSGASDTGGSGSLAVSDVLLLALKLDVLLVVVVNVKAKSGRVDVAVAPDEESAEDGLGENVEDTIKDSLGVGRDVVTTLAKTPSNRVKSPQDSGQRAAGQEGPADIFAHGVGVLAGLPSEDVDDVSQCDTSEYEVTPLVAGPDKSTGKSSDNHDPVDEDDVEHGRPGHASGEKQIGEQQRCGDEPVNVAD